jgi:hypothetical protein
MERRNEGNDEACGPEMRKVMAVEWMTLDGVVQAPGHRDEDRDGGFEHGGWHLPYFDDAAREWVVEGYVAAGGFLFGHRTYEDLAGTGRTLRRRSRSPPSR